MLECCLFLGGPLRVPYLSCYRYAFLACRLPICLFRFGPLFRSTSSPLVPALRLGALAWGFVGFTTEASRRAVRCMGTLRLSLAAGFFPSLLLNSRVRHTWALGSQQPEALGPRRISYSFRHAKWGPGFAFIGESVQGLLSAHYPPGFPRSQSS